MRKFLVALVALLAAASTAHAASISVEVTFPFWTGEDIPGPGDTVILTITATANAGEMDDAVYGALSFSNPGMVSSGSVSQTALESFGVVPWTTGAVFCESLGCPVFNQLAGMTPFSVSNTPLVISTLTFTLVGVGELHASWDEGFDFFGAPTPPDVCIIGLGAGCPVIPEPATGALLGLGLLGLAAARRRRHA